jgi:hypothetical protein
VSHTDDLYEQIAGLMTGPKVRTVVEALQLIVTIGCTLDEPGARPEERTFCRADGSAHSCYCAVGIARRALDALPPKPNETRETEP